jgi:hypothetical protein
MADRPQRVRRAARRVAPSEVPDDVVNHLLRVL